MAINKSFLFICLSSIIFGCVNNEPKQEVTKTDSTAKKVALDYPYTAKYSLNWQPGDEQNAVVVLNSIKKYMDGDIKGSFSNFADSVTFEADKFLFKGTKDSLENLMTPMRAQIASMSFQPDTWLTAYYPDKNETWVIGCEPGVGLKRHGSDLGPHWSHQVFNPTPGSQPITHVSFL